MCFSLQSITFGQIVFDFPKARISDFKYAVYNLTISPTQHPGRS